MTKIVATKTLLSLALAATALSLAACSPEFHEGRDPHMNLSTPPMVQTAPQPRASMPEANNMRNRNMMLSSQPVIIEGGQPRSSTSADVQMLGQPGAGPSVLSPNVESMPDMHILTDETYPHASR